MSSLCKVCGKWMDGNICRNCGALATDVGKKTVGSTHCPTCNKLIDIDAPFCPYCGKNSAEGEDAPERVKCAFCGKMMKKTAAFCPSCGKPPVKKMYKCPSCGRETEEDTPFCPGCGISREVAGAINKGVCINCGNRLAPDAVFCPNCGKSTGNRTSHTAPPLYGAYAPYRGGYYVKSPSETLATREKASGLVWLAVAIIQALVAWYFFDNSWDWGEYTWISYAIISLWNFSVAYQSLQRSKRVEARISGIVAEYDAMFTSCIVFIVINVLFGGVVGVAGAIFNLLNRSYAIKNAPYLEER